MFLDLGISIIYSDGWPALNPGTALADQHWLKALWWLTSPDPGYPLSRQVLLLYLWGTDCWPFSGQASWSYLSLASDWIVTINKLTVAKETHRVQFPLVSMIVRDESTVLNYHCKREPNILYRFPKYSAQIVLLEEKLVSLHVIHLIQFISLIVPFVCLNFGHAKQFDLW